MAICAASRRREPSHDGRRVDETVRRAADSLEPSSRLGPDEARESLERPDDLDAPAPRRSYASPRHCYRLPTRTGPPSLGSLVPNRSVGVLTRALADFAPRNTKPPVREPNVPEKRERKDEKRDRKEKKPVMRTERGTVDGGGSGGAAAAAIAAEDNPRGGDNPDATAFRHEWGVKLAEEPAAVDAAERGERYVTRRLWGVNVKRPDPDVEGPAVAVAPDESKSSGSVAPKRETADGAIASCEALRRIARTSPDLLGEAIAIDEDYYVPEDVSPDAEIAAWRSVAARSKIPRSGASLSAGQLNVLTIRPEAPQPRLDVRVVRSAEDGPSEREIGQSLKSADVKRSGGAEARIVDSKKLHTAAAWAPIRPDESPATDRADRTRTNGPRAFASAFSTNTENFEPGSSDRKSDGGDKSVSLESDERRAPSAGSLASRAGGDRAATSDVVAGKEMDSSIESRGVDRESVSAEAARKDESRAEEVRAEKFHAGYDRADTHDGDASHVDLISDSDPSIDVGLVEASAIGERESAEGGPKSVAEESAKDAPLRPNATHSDDDSRAGYVIDGDYVRVPGDPYPYSRQHLEKWRVPRSGGSVYKSIKRETIDTGSPSVSPPSPGNANDAYGDAGGKGAYGTRAGTVIRTSGSDDGDGDGASAKNLFRVSSAAASDRLLGDAADALGLRQWTDAFSRLDGQAAGATEETSRVLY